MTIDISRARRETPGCAEVLHFDNAGASLPPEPVLEAVIEHLRLEARLGGYLAEDRAAERLEGFYAAAARLAGCAPDEIAFTESATRAWQSALLALKLGPGDRILTSQAEYGSNLIGLLQVGRRFGCEVVALPGDVVDPEAVRAALDGRVRLVALTHVPSNGGQVAPVAAIGALTRAAGVPFLLDACQSLGQMPIDVDAIGCDFLCATGRKFLRGPRGTGFLYVRRALLAELEPICLDNHGARYAAPAGYTARPDARKFESYECSVAGKLGLAAAIEYAMAWGLDAIEARVRLLADRLRARLAEIPGVVVRDPGPVRCAIVTCTVEGDEPARLREALWTERINTSVSGPSAAPLDMAARRLGAVLRASVHYYNTEDEVDRFTIALARVAGAR